MEMKKMNCIANMKREDDVQKIKNWWNANWTLKWNWINKRTFANRREECKPWRGVESSKGLHPITFIKRTSLHTWSKISVQLLIWMTRVEREARSRKWKNEKKGGEKITKANTNDEVIRNERIGKCWSKESTEEIARAGRTGSETQTNLRRMLGAHFPKKSGTKAALQDGVSDGSLLYHHHAATVFSAIEICVYERKIIANKSRPPTRTSLCSACPEERENDQRKSK